MQESSRRHRQVANAIREELVTILRKDISDPRLEMAGMITVSGVDLAPDMRNATVWLSFMGKEEKSPEVQGALEALESAGGFVHRLLIKRISMKVHPRLLFRFDKMFDRATVVNAALKEAAAFEQQAAAQKQPEPEADSAEEDPDQK